MEGRISQRVTKATHAKNTNYSTNKFNIDQLRPLVSFGNGSGSYPNEISINLAPNKCGTLVTDSDTEDVFSITNDEEMVVQLDAGEVPEKGGILLVEEKQQMEGQATGGGTTNEQ